MAILTRCESPRLLSSNNRRKAGTVQEDHGMLAIRSPRPWRLRLCNPPPSLGHLAVAPIRLMVGFGVGGALMSPPASSPNSGRVPASASWSRTNCAGGTIAGDLVAKGPGRLQRADDLDRPRCRGDDQVQAYDAVKDFLRRSVFSPIPPSPSSYRRIPPRTISRA